MFSICVLFTSMYEPRNSLMSDSKHVAESQKFFGGGRSLIVTRADKFVLICAGCTMTAFKWQEQACYTKGGAEGISYLNNYFLYYYFNYLLLSSMATTTFAASVMLVNSYSSHSGYC